MPRCLEFGALLLFQYEIDVNRITREVLFAKAGVRVTIWAILFGISLPSRSQKSTSLFQFSFSKPLREQLPKSWVRLQLLSQLATL